MLQSLYRDPRSGACEEGGAWPRQSAAQHTRFILKRISRVDIILDQLDISLIEIIVTKTQQLKNRLKKSKLGYFILSEALGLSPLCLRNPGIPNLRSYRHVDYRQF